MTTDHNVVPLDPGRRSRRQALKADEACLAAIVSAARHLAESNLVGRAHAAAAQVMADGLPSQSMGEPGAGSGDHGDPTLAAVVQREGMGRLLNELRSELERGRSAIVHAGRIAAGIASATVAPAESDAPGQGHCQRCARWVSGSASDRVRSGYCPACYQAWRRSGMVDRSEFNRNADDSGEPSA
jgi:hypothetical protein